MNHFLQCRGDVNARSGPMVDYVLVLCCTLGVRPQVPLDVTVKCNAAVFFEVVLGSNMSVISTVLYYGMGHGGRAETRSLSTQKTRVQLRDSPLRRDYFSSRSTADRIRDSQFTLKVTFRIVISNAILLYFIERARIDE